MRFTLIAVLWLTGFASTPLFAGSLPWIVVSREGSGFMEQETGRPFIPSGFNYDHDASGRLIEDYWDAEWAAIEGDFAEMKQLGANVVRIHLQFGRFMSAADQPNPAALKQLQRLLRLAESTGLYLDLTGLGCYHKPAVPEWYDLLSEADRWQAQARFWTAIADTCKASPAIFCYDLMNEPVVPGGQRKPRDWLGPAFGDKHFVQVIALDQRSRPRPEIAQAWIRTLTQAIRKVDPRHLVTVGLVDWSLDRPGLTSGFVPSQIAADLDFLCVHLYPKTGKLPEAFETLKGFQVGKPLVIEETFPLGCTLPEFKSFLDGAAERKIGVIGFYWGTPVDELKKSTSIGDALLRQWLELFQQSRPPVAPPK